MLDSREQTGLWLNNLLNPLLGPPVRLDVDVLLGGTRWQTKHLFWGFPFLFFSSTTEAICNFVCKAPEEESSN